MNQHDDDVTLSRLLDGRGKAADWRRLREAIAADATTWDRVIGCATDQDGLGALVADAGDRAGNIELGFATTAPNAESPSDSLRIDHHRADGRRSDRAVRSARLGWLVAACMALGLVSVALRPRNAAPMNNAGGNTAGFSLDKMTASDFMNGYKERAEKDGTLVAEMPQRVVLESRATPDGKGHEVLYLRQFIERAVVDDLYKFGVDESGRPVMVPASLEKPRSAGAM
ncbi:MAG: hypothetical protein QM783_00360 [Phycisphaerales bacterium]